MGDTGNNLMQMIIRLKPGFPVPDYLTVRAENCAGLKTVDVDECDLDRLVDEPGVESFQGARPIHA